jgi:hypothetical protein
MLTFTTSMIIAVVCVVVGTGLGMMISMAFSNRGNESKNPPAEAESPHNRVAALLRDRQDSSLLVELDGRVYASAEPLSQKQHELLENACREWRNWLRVPPENEEGPSPVGNAARAASSQSKTVPVADLSRAARENLPAAPPVGVAVPPLVAAAVASNVERSAPPPAAARSIVEQIDEILQDMVSGTPLAEKSIRLVEEPDSDVIVWIGLEHFEGINNVPDIEARTIIQAAVREWEKKSEAKANNRPY